jgi:signal transduction histidine kinase
VKVLERLASRAGTGAEVVLGLGMALAIVFSALLLVRADGGWPAGLGIGLVICAVAILRKRNRAAAVVIGLTLFAAAGIAVAAGIVALGPPFGGGLAGLLVLGAAAARTLPPRPAAIISVAGTFVIGISETAGPDGLFDHRVFWAVAGVTLWSAALAAGLYVRYLDFLHRQTLETARRQERIELARELHDVVAHHVTGVVVQAQAARFAGKDDPGTLLSTLGNIETAGTATLAAIRQVVGLLRESGDSESVSPDPEPISQLVQRFAVHGPAVDLRVPASMPDSGWPPEVTSTMYRVVQEALTNIARHAPGARSVIVQITHDPQQVRVEVTDDAPAVAPRRPWLSGGYGLVGMRERVEALGGKLQAGPRTGVGWAVEASLPVPARGRP